MKFKSIPVSKRWKSLIGMYTFRKLNKHNDKIESRFLTLLGWFSIISFFIFMISGIFLFSYLTYNKIDTRYIQNEENYLTKSSTIGLLVPSISKDTIQEVQEESEEVYSGDKNIDDVVPKYIVWLPFYLFIPIIFISTFIHEFGHYIFCRRAGVKVKEYGLGCPYLLYIPIPLLFAYVDPAKTQLEKSSKFNFLSIITAGCFFNILLIIPTFISLFVLYSKFTFYLFQINFSYHLCILFIIRRAEVTTSKCT